MDFLILCGSLRAQSLNAAMARAAADLLPEPGRATWFGALDQLPHFNPDVEEVGLPEQPARLRELVGEASGLILACPEYAHGATGIMKNTLEWLVGGVELTGKPVALISASTAATGGIRAQAWMRETLEVMGADVMAESVLGPSARRKITDGTVTDEGIRSEIAALMKALVQRAHVSDEDYLAAAR